MAHILILGAAMEALEAKMSDPPTTSQTNLDNALDSADEWAHENEEQTETIQQIEAKAGEVNDYIGICATPPTAGQDVRLQGYADDLEQILP